MHAHHPHADQHAALEHEGELAAGLAEEAIALAAGLLDHAGTEVRRVVDLGCGPGVGTTALAGSFPLATVVAVDASPVMLERAAARAEGLGCAARVETRRLDLNGDLGTLGRCDLMWASMSIHHASDEVATLGGLRALLAPLGLLCVLERDDPLDVRFADQLGRAGIWDRLEAARRRRFEHRRDGLPGALKTEIYPAMLAAAGLDVVVERSLRGSVEVPHDPAMHQFVTGVLRRSLTDLAPFAAEADLEALRRFLDEPPPPPGRWEAASSRKLFIARPMLRG